MDLTSFLTREIEEAALSGTEMKGEWKPSVEKRNQLQRCGECVKGYQVGCS